MKETLMQTIGLAKAKLNLAKKSLGENILAGTTPGTTSPNLKNLETGVKTTYEGAIVQRIPN